MTQCQKVLLNISLAIKYNSLKLFDSILIYSLCVVLSLSVGVCVHYKQSLKVFGMNFTSSYVMVFDFVP